MKGLASMLMLVCYLPFAGMQDIAFNSLPEATRNETNVGRLQENQLRTIGPCVSVLPGPMPINAEPRVKMAMHTVFCHMYGW